MAGLGWGPKDNTTKAERDAARTRAEQQMAEQRGETTDADEQSETADRITARHRRARRPN